MSPKNESYRTNKMKMPIWLLSRLAFSVVVIMAAFLAFVSAFFTIGAFASLLEWELPMTIIGLAIASGCMFLTMLFKGCASWIHNKYF